MEENFHVFDFSLSEDDMAVIATIDQKQSSFFSHTDPNMVEWFVRMVDERKQQHDCTKDKKKLVIEKDIHEKNIYNLPHDDVCGRKN